MVLVYNTGMSAIAELNINLVSANDALFLTSMILRFAQSLWTRRYFYRALFALGCYWSVFSYSLFTHKHPGEAARSILVVLTAAGFAWVISYAIKYCF